MKTLLLVIFLALTTLLGDEVKIATYNVENLFDLHRSGHEYKEYIPFSRSQWNQKAYRTKLKNIAKVISQMKPDIIGLQEIESERALQDLQAALNKAGHYMPYKAITKHKDTTVKNALLSRYPIISKKDLQVTHSYAFRDILEVAVDIHGKKLYLFVNHWKSKSGPESMRIVSAKVLKNRLNMLPISVPAIVMGDLNSDYEEYILFKRKRKHNNTYGKTGINHILKTVDKEKRVSLQDLCTCKNCLFNLWYELPQKERWSHKYRSSYEALDHIIINSALHDKEGLEYKVGSFNRYMPKYLVYKKYKKQQINRWKMSKRPNAKHLGKGYSDHLPIYAIISTTK